MAAEPTIDDMIMLEAAETSAQNPSGLLPASSDSSYTSEEEESVYASSASDDEDDPIINEYKVFITDPSPASDLYVLQFIGRPSGQGLAGASAPTEMRMKPESGYFEVDVPLNIHQFYDRQKGVRFGEALRRTKAFGQQGYGEAAGFQRTMPRSTKRPGAASAGGGGAGGDDAGEGEDENAPPKNFLEDDNLDEYVHNFEDANEKGHVLNTVTWGGRLLGQEDWKPNYMIGAFRGNELHLTPLRGIVQLRPELHHLDATAHLDAAGRRRETTEPKDVLTTTKKLTDEKTAEELLKGSAAEKWVKMGWVDCETEAALDARTSRLYLQDTENAQIIEWESKEEYVERVLPVVVGKEPPKVQKVR